MQIKFLKNWAIIQLPYNSDRSSICTIVILADDIPHWDVVTYSRKLLIKIISFMTFIAQLGLLILLVWPFFLESEAGTTFTVVFFPLFLLIAFKSYVTPCNFIIILDISAHLLLQFVNSIAHLYFIFQSPCQMSDFYAKVTITQHQFCCISYDLSWHFDKTL